MYKRGTNWVFNTATIRWMLNRRPSHVTNNAKQRNRKMTFLFRKDGVFLNRTKYKQQRSSNGKKLYKHHW